MTKQSARPSRRELFAALAAFPDHLPAPRLASFTPYPDGCVNLKLDDGAAVREWAKHLGVPDERVIATATDREVTTAAFVDLAGWRAWVGGTDPIASGRPSGEIWL